jgi:hypothetical protein
LALDVTQQNLHNTIDVDSLNKSSLQSNVLLHELQLGEQLNECVHQERRADFSLMLAMLCDDVREQSQFSLPQSDVDTKDETNAYLRQHFQLPKQSPLSLENLEQIQEYNQAQDIIDNNLVNIHLTNVLQPKPLNFRNDALFITNTVMENTSIVCQEKRANSKQDAILNKRSLMNVDAWLQNIQTSLVKSRLIPDIAA